MVPVIGARTSVSSSVMRAFSTATWERTTSALALANSSWACSKSTSLMVRSSNSFLARLLCASAIARRALAASSRASAWRERCAGALVDLHQQRAGLHDLAGLALDLQHLARGLRLDLHRDAGSIGPGSVDGDDDVARPTGAVSYVGLAASLLPAAESPASSGGSEPRSIHPDLSHWRTSRLDLSVAQADDARCASPRRSRRASPGRWCCRWRAARRTVRGYPPPWRNRDCPSARRPAGGWGGHQRPGHGDALALAARQLAGPVRMRSARPTCSSAAPRALASLAASRRRRSAAARRCAARRRAAAG